MKPIKEIKVGDYIGALNPIFIDPIPFRYSLEVLGVGKRIKCGLRNGSFKLLYPKEIVSVFSSQEEGDAVMGAAYRFWGVENAKVIAAKDAMKNAVLDAIKNIAPPVQS